MPNTFDQPDLELALRGRPAELQPLRIEVVPQPPERPRQRYPRRPLNLLVRRKWLLLSIVAIGAIAGLLIAASRETLHTARISLEVTPPATAEVVIRRASASKVIEGSAQAIELSTLSEYARPKNWFEAVTGTPSAMPREEEFLPAVERNVKFSATSDGRVIDIDFQASDPPRATAFLDLLAQEVSRNHSDARSETLASIRKTYAVELTTATADFEKARALLADATARNAAAAASEANRSAVAADRLEAARQDFEAKRRALESVQQRIRDAQNSAAETGNVRPLAPARLLPEKASTSAFLTVFLGILAGLFVGIPLCFAREATDQVVRDPEDLPHHTGINPLGVIPRAGLRRSSRLGPGIPDLTGSSVFAPGGPLDAAREIRSEALSEAFRHVLASIWIAGQNNKRARVILLTSPGQRDGKTTAMANLGIALANTRRRVLILDANMRRPQLHMMFGAPPTWGLANILEGDIPIEDYDFEDIVFKTNIPGLYVLPAGSGHLTIAGMRHVDRLRDLLLRFRLEFHAVLIDTPSAFDYPDARILAKLSDAAVIIARADKTRRDRAATLAGQLQEDGVAVLGAVLNDYRNVQRQ